MSTEAKGLTNSHLQTAICLVSERIGRRQSDIRYLPPGRGPEAYWSSARWVALRAPAGKFPPTPVLLLQRFAVSIGISLAPLSLLYRQNQSVQVAMFKFHNKINGLHYNFLALQLQTVYMLHQEQFSPALRLYNLWSSDI